MLLGLRNVILSYLLLNKHISRCQTQFPLLLSSSQLFFCTERAEADFVSSSKLQKNIR